MTRPCGCGGTLIDTCNCAIVPGPNVTVTGTGTGEDPYVIGATTAAVQALDTESVDMTVSGAGTGGSPYLVSGDVRRNPAAGNLLTSTPSGLLVACTAVQDCVAEAIGPGLLWNAADRRYQARISTAPGNLLLIAPDGGLYASDSGGLLPSQPRARVRRSTDQSIPTGAGLTTPVSYDTVAPGTTAGMWAIGTPTRLTCVQAGGYNVGANIQWQTLGADANSGHRLVILRRNGTETLVADQRDTSRSQATIQNVSTQVDLAVGDYIEVLVRHIQPGIPINLTAAVNFAQTMWMYYTTEGS